VAPEVEGMSGYSDTDKVTRYQTKTHWDGTRETSHYTGLHSKADAAGLQRQYVGSKFVDGKYVPQPDRYTLRLVEVKVSLADFRSGYCTGGHFVYVLTPPGLLTPEMLPPGIGLMEADPDKLWWGGIKYLLQGIDVRVKARRKEAWTEKHYGEIWHQRVLSLIASRLSNIQVYDNPWVGPHLTRSSEYSDT
jgi:hypothetical protein